VYVACYRMYSRGVRWTELMHERGVGSFLDRESCTSDDLERGSGCLSCPFYTYLVSLESCF
jgi:hypothetical protein